MGFDQSKQFAFIKSIATGDGDTDLMTAPATGETLWVCQINVTIVTAAAQAFRIEDKGGSPIVYFSAPASLAVGTYNVPLGPMGVAVSASATTLEYDCAAAGVACVVSGWGYIRA
jgi:hypothetical protein